jgi:hypothetical protein
MPHLQELFAEPLYGPNVMGDAVLPSKECHVWGPMGEPLAWVEFTDGQIRSVWELGSRQYVLDDDGLPVFGTWLTPREDISRRE